MSSQPEEGRDKCPYGPTTGYTALLVGKPFDGCRSTFSRVLSGSESLVFLQTSRCTRLPSTSSGAFRISAATLRPPRWRPKTPPRAGWTVSGSPGITKAIQGQSALICSRSAWSIMHQSIVLKALQLCFTVTIIFVCLLSWRQLLLKDWLFDGQSSLWPRMFGLDLFCQFHINI